MLARLLHTIELHIQLKLAIYTPNIRQHFAERRITSHANSIGIDKHVPNLWMRNRPAQNAFKLRMNGWLATRKLQDVNQTLARNHALNARLHIIERCTLGIPTNTVWTLCVAGWASQITTINNLNQRNARGKLLERIGGCARWCTATACTTTRRAFAGCIRGISLTGEVPARIALQSHHERAVLHALLLHKHRAGALNNPRGNFHGAYWAATLRHFDRLFSAMNGNSDHCISDFLLLTSCQRCRKQTP